MWGKMIIDHYDNLSFDEKEYYNKIYYGILKGKDSIRLLGLFDAKVLDKIIMVLKYEHAEIFYVDFQRMEYVITPEELIYYIHYTMPVEMRNRKKHVMENWIADSQGGMKIQASDSESDIYRKVHNYLIRNISYNYEALQNPETYPDAFTISGIFENKKAVCEGIAKAFKVLCDYAGAKNVYVVNGTALSKRLKMIYPHTWNMVKFNGQYSHIDVTWDLEPSRTSRYNRYDYFMVPDEWMQKDHDYDNSIRCDAVEQSYFYRQSCLIPGPNSLKKFLDEKLQNKISVLYFRINGENGLPDDIDSKVDNIVQEAVRKYATSDYMIQTVSNQLQNIYFYKISDRW